jgi:hypothetical protein
MLVCVIKSTERKMESNFGNVRDVSNIYQVNHFFHQNVALVSLHDARNVMDYSLWLLETKNFTKRQTENICAGQGTLTQNDLGKENVLLRELVPKMKRQTLGKSSIMLWIRERLSNLVIAPNVADYARLQLITMITQNHYGLDGFVMSVIQIIRVWVYTFKKVEKP